MVCREKEREWICMRFCVRRELLRQWKRCALQGGMVAGYGCGIWSAQAKHVRIKDKRRWDFCGAAEENRETGIFAKHGRSFAF